MYAVFKHAADEESMDKSTTQFLPARRALRARPAGSKIAFMFSVCVCVCVCVFVRKYHVR